jgi:transcriptional regulator
MELLQGTLDVLVLKALSRGTDHGYGIARWIRETTDGTILVEDRALYVALHRLAAKGWIEAEWRTTENNRRAKYYRLTRAGRRELAERATDFTEYANAVFKILRST